MSLDPAVTQQLALAAAREPSLDMLLVFGSRARGDAHARSDWDVAYIADERFDPDAFLARVVGVLRSDRVDLVDLERAGALLRFQAARDGQLVHERTPGAFERFWISAVSFWCDVQPVLGPAYKAMLVELDSR